jgi:hypothetical protein
MSLRKGEQTIKIVLQEVRIGFSALAVWACGATQAAPPVITNITQVGATPQFGVQSDLGITNQIQYCTNLRQTNWEVLTNLLVLQSPYWFVDVAAPLASQRFYRVVELADHHSRATACPTAPLGWNSWNTYYTSVSEANMLAVAHYLNTNGLAEAGWDLVQIDDGQTSVKSAFWSGDDRNLKPRFFAQMKPQSST